MKTIIHIMNYGAPYSGNFIKLINQLTDNLKINYSINSIYILPLSSQSMIWVKELSKDGYRILFYPDKFFHKVYFYLKLLYKYQPCIIHFHFTNTKNILALKIASLGRKKYKLIYHCHSEFKPHHNIYVNKIRNMIISSDIYIGVSNSVSSNLALHYPENKIKTVFNCIDISRLNNYRRDMRKQLNINEDKVVFLMFGYDYYIKGIDIAIDALQSIALQKNIILVISVAKNKEAIKNNIIKQIGKYPEWIILLDPIEDIASYYNMADYFLSASRTEGFSYALVEASYCNCIPISSDIIGISHAKRIPYMNIYTNNPHNLTELIINIINIPINSRHTIKTKQREYIINHYNYNSWIKNIISIYKDVTSLYDI